MRVYVPHYQRRPQPEPAVTNDTLAFAVGLGGWLAGLGITLWMLLTSDAADPARTLTTIAVGLALGVIGLLVSRRQHHSNR
jgi:hypothetical protein